MHLVSRDGAGGARPPLVDDPQTHLTDFYVNQISLVPALNSQPHSQNVKNLEMLMTFLTVGYVSV